MKITAKGCTASFVWPPEYLNEGYYQWEIEAISIWALSDTTVIEVNPTINAGTAGVLNLMSILTTAETWEQPSLRRGVYRTYTSLFGNPFSYAYEPLLPDT